MTALYLARYLFLGALALAVFCFVVAEVVSSRRR
jgi:hypothetical protein